ncbi:hypothetical protein [Acrocarpospora sp. B8E8]|uniref:hypothetical protein n=1 Tax=Acrocarpospora sp. B8E8 TaxID=3153572 RepID=UPI00325DF6B4
MLLVERALRDRRLLDAKWVDGYFGTTTVAAYAKYQKSLGLTGLDTNGLPGKTSLTRLGAGRFKVTNVIDPGTRVSTGGFVINTRTRSMLAEAKRLLGRDLTLDQGSYNPGGDPTSAGTHDGGGVVDVSPPHPPPRPPTATASARPASSATTSTATTKDRSPTSPDRSPTTPPSSPPATTSRDPATARANASRTPPPPSGTRSSKPSASTTTPATPAHTRTSAQAPKAT